MDNGSDVFDSTNPYNPSKGRALSYFDLPHNFVASYTVQLPVNSYFAKGNIASRLTAGWAVSGITSFVTGEVIDISK
jgi:hypothetical protein